ncbi:ubiquinone anaerobic biosynthesis accessory factor UbiT [Veronia pacifica]|uniref:Ubiquinone biosynthesis accessory factor UbiT n=1 Tax=Veronia pacifica TaxID=1080227 RepID=A0A1C3EK80_9GAMM|nr:SCP2 domain-containing protein [Veronia pacifica]ODA33644.1 sterol-binding protein [Veronia pacifica]
MISTIHTQLVTHTPAAFRLPLQLTPHFVQREILVQALQHIFREALEDGDFTFLKGRWLEIHITDIDTRCVIGYKEGSLISSHTAKKPDVSMKANLNDLILLAARKEDPDTLFFQRRLMIEGDTELGLEVKNLLDSIELDSLPSVLKHGLVTLADFIHKGLHAQAKGIQNNDAHQNGSTCRYPSN